MIYFVGGAEDWAGRFHGPGHSFKTLMYGIYDLQIIQKMEKT